MVGSLTQYLSVVFTIIGAILSGLGIYLTLTLDADQSIVQALDRIQYTFLISFLILSLILIVVLRLYLVHKRYSRAYEVINCGFTQSHKNLYDEEHQKDFTKAIESFKIFCTHIKNAFSKISGSTCSVCIKLFEEHENDICLTTLCRDYEATTNSKRIDPENDPPQKLKDNTDFSDIFTYATKHDNKEHKFFFCNNLPSEHDYVNSRIDRSVFPPKKWYIFGFKTILRHINWPLPYKSTIVVPITPLSDGALHENRIEGFLCLDSNSLFAFRKKYDINIMCGIADGLYPAMKTFNESHGKEEQI